MDNNPWNLDSGNTTLYQPQYHPSSAPTHNEFSDRDAAFAQKYPLLCSVPNNQLFTTAMQGGNQAINISGLSDEIMMLARSYVQVERELYQYKNEYDTLLERNQELEDKIAKHQKKNHSASTTDSSLQQQNVSLQQQVQSLEQQLATNSQMQQQNVSLQKRVQDLEQTANASSKSVSHSHHRSAEHPDPDVFSADHPELRKDLHLFIRKINMKFIANEDRYP